jgi:hypothetical protein
MHWRHPSGVVAVGVTNPAHRCTGQMTLKRGDPFECRSARHPRPSPRKRLPTPRATNLLGDVGKRDSSGTGSPVRIRRHTANQTPRGETLRLQSSAGSSGGGPRASAARTNGREYAGGSVRADHVATATRARRSLRLGPGRAGGSLNIKLVRSAANDPSSISPSTCRQVPAHL